jgi:hypothetical protein
MAATSMAALRAAVQTALASATSVPVFYGEPIDLKPSECIWLGKATDATQEPAALRKGRVKRDEDYEFDVTVWVASKARPADSEARAVAIATVIEETIADDPRVNDTPGVLFCVVDAVEMDTTETGDLPVTILTYTLRTRGRML